MTPQAKDLHGFSYNRTATFDYHAQQVSGSWAVSSISLPNDQIIRYTYGTSGGNAGKLTEIEHPDGTFSRFEYGVDSGLSFINFNDAVAERTHRRKRVFYSTDISVIQFDGTEGDRGFQLFNQSSMQIRAAVNPNNELIYANLSGDGQAGSPANVRLVYEGAGKMKRIEALAEAAYLRDITIDNGASGIRAVNGEPEETFGQACE